MPGSTPWKNYSRNSPVTKTSSTKPSTTGVWCDHHKNDTHSTDECRYLKYLKKGTQGTSSTQGKGTYNRGSQRNTQSKAKQSAGDKVCNHCGEKTWPHPVKTCIENIRAQMGKNSNTNVNDDSRKRKREDSEDNKEVQILLRRPVP